MMGSPNTFLVINPRSAGGATERHYSKIMKAVGEAIGEFGHALTTGAQHATALTREALQAGYNCVVAVGGDGTVNEVLNGFFDQQGRLLRRDATLGIIPLGTGGDFRRTLGWSLDLEQAIERLKGDSWRAIDVGHVKFMGHDGVPSARYFLNIASAGVSGQVDWEVNHVSKAFGGKISFSMATLKALLKYHDHPVQARFDGGPNQEMPVTVLAVANGQYFGCGMWVAPDARPDDGIFDVTHWHGYRLRDFVLKRRGIYDGQHVNFSKTRRFQARSVSLESAHEVLLDVDGEQPGRLPATMTILPGALRLKVAADKTITT